MRYLVYIFLIVVTISCTKEKAEYEERPTYKFMKEGTLTLNNADGSRHDISIELAETEQERGKGLMFRDSMENNQGMLFIGENEVQGFYMRNTKIPLDLVYISKDSLVVDIQQGIPFNEQPIPSDTISMYVLELNQGVANKLGIKENQTKVSWQKD